MKMNRYARLGQHFLHLALAFWAGTIVSIAVGIQPVWAQQNDSDHPDSKWYTQAESFSDQAKYDSALVYYRKAAEDYQTKEWGRKYLMARIRIGEMLQWLGKYDEALEETEQTLSYAEQHKIRSKEYPQILNTLAGIQLELDNYEEVEALTYKAIDFIKQHFGEENLYLASSYMTLGNLSRNKGNFDQALDYFNKTKRIREQLLEPDDLRLTAVYNNIAVIFYFKGKLYKSVDMFKQAAETVRMKKGEFHPDVAGYYNNVGIVYRELGDLKEAAKYFTKSLTIQRKLFGEMHPDLGRTYSSLANLYRNMEEYDKALEYLKKDLAIAIETQGPNHYDVARTYYSLANVYRQTEDWQAALNSVDKYFNIANEHFPEGHSDMMKAYLLRFEIYSDQDRWEKAKESAVQAYELGKSLESYEKITLANTANAVGMANLHLSHLEEALDAFQQSLAIWSPNFEPNVWIENPKMTRELYVKDIVLTLTNKAEALSKYYLQTDDSEYRNAALTTFDLAVQVIDKLQQEYRNEESKLFLGAKSQLTFEKAIQASKAFYDRTNNERFLERAFHYAEKSRSRVILEQIFDSEAKQFAGVPDSLSQIGEGLREQIAELQLDLASASFKQDSLKAATLRDSLFRMDDHLNDHIRLLEKKYPNYYALKYNSTVVSAKRFSDDILQEGQALVQYFKGVDHQYTFVLRKNGVQLFQQPADSALDQKIKSFRTSILEHDQTTFRKLGHQLYATLLEPAEPALNGVQELIIVPDGSMYYLPFETLLSQNSSAGSNYRSLPYVVRNFDISYIPSATIYWRDRERRSHMKETSKEFLAMAPLFMDVVDQTYTPEPIRSDSITPLPMTKYEVNSIAKEFREQKSGLLSWLWNDAPEPTVLMEREATESRIKQGLMSNYKYLHFATHAYIKEDQPNLSGIQFYNENGSDEDGVLLANEVYNLDINADLVVLSACDTGLGEVMRGEGLIGFTRPFIYAGASNMMVSLWKVADRSTAESMIGFYHHVLEGEAFNSSLRQVKLEMIQSGRFADPWYWSPFVLIGQ
jgi:CHAT domain-containing protein